MITRESTIGDLLKNPIGKDVLSRLTQFAAVPAELIDNPLMRSIKLKTLPKLAPKTVDDGLLDALLELFNQDEDGEDALPSDERPWWKSAVVYQIYPRSFQDSDGDGIGDLRGIVNRLDYLHDLGVTALWLCPVYDSPNDDNGYDVRDYRKIMTEFGSMEDMEALIAGLHQRGMRLIMDLVVNHTSDEHQWFVESKLDPSGPYGDYYIWRDGVDDHTPPNNWVSHFSGPAWKYFPERKQWALHLFSKKQMDLNWDNPAVRQGVYDIVNFWRDKGVDGFRLDVISFISKTSLADGNETLGKLMGFYGVEHYFYGNRLHEYLRGIKKNGFADAFTIGETPGTGPEMNKLLTGANREELSTVFCFDHVDGLGKMRFDVYRYDLNHLKKCFIDYQGAYADVSWPTIFVENHDNPRMPSKVDPREEYRERIAKLLAVILLTARGTVFLYQGQEIGMGNVDFNGMEELRDVESINRYADQSKKIGAEQAWQQILGGTRDHARTPMLWDAGKNGGFTTGEPWIRTNRTRANVEAQQKDPDSVLSFYKALIRLRKEQEALVFGDFEPLHANKKDLFCYIRRAGEQRFYIEANLSDHGKARPKPPQGAERILCNYGDVSETLRPYEAAVYRF